MLLHHEGREVIKRFLMTEEQKMNTAITEVKSLLERLPEDSTYEDIQYHLYVVEKIRRGIDRSTVEGTLSQDEVELKFGQWLTK